MEGALIVSLILFQSLGLLGLGLGLGLLCLGWGGLALEELLVIVCKCGRFGLICGSASC
jgi:hypothetical protein